MRRWPSHGLSIGLSVSLALASTFTFSATAAAVPPRTSPASTGAPWAQLFEEGRTAYSQGRFEDAAEAFYRAREMGGPPSLLYNQALCLDELGRGPAAASAYRRYLDRSPDAANREAVLQRIRVLEAPAPPPEPSIDDIEAGGLGVESPPTIASQIAPPPPLMELLALEASDTMEQVWVGEGRPVAPRTEPDFEEVGPEWVASWFLLVATLGSTAGAIGVWVDGQATFDALREQCIGAGGCTPETIAGSSAHASELATNVLLVSSLVLGTATVLSFLIEGATSAETRVYVEAGPASLSLRGTF